MQVFTIEGAVICFPLGKPGVVCAGKFDQVHFSVGFGRILIKEAVPVTAGTGSSGLKTSSRDLTRLNI